MELKSSSLDQFIMARPDAEEAAFLRAICSAKEDNLPRLVYADWLDERGREARARFIRLQIELEQCDKNKRALIADLKGDISILHANNGDAWLRDLPRWFRMNPESTPALADYERGFLASATVEASHYVSFGEQLLRVAPIRRVSLFHAGKMARQLAECRGMRLVELLDLSRNKFSDDFAILARSTHVFAIRELNLDYCGIDDRGVRALAYMSTWTGLKVLSLVGNNLTTKGVREIANSRVLRTLEQLDLSWNDRLTNENQPIYQWFPNTEVLHRGMQFDSERINEIEMTIIRGGVEFKISR